MGSITTTLGHAVTHCHLGDSPCNEEELDAAQIKAARALAAEINPNAVEVSPPTAKFNCHGFAYAHSHGWVNRPRRFINDDYDQLPLSEARRHDVVIYKNGNTITHSAIVTKVVQDTIVELRSKWGELAVLSHTLEEVPEAYGAATHVLRHR